MTYKPYITTGMSSNLPAMLFGHKELIDKLKSNTYMKAVEELQTEYRPEFMRIESQYIASEDKQTLLNELAREFVEEADKEYTQIAKKIERDRFLMNCNMIMGSFVIPSIIEFRGQFSEPLVDVLLEQWNARFTQYKLLKGRLQDIEGAFHKKLCYITTAVCTGLGKPDDCYELNLLRTFRDDYLLKEDGGEALIADYYETAPGIVMAMSQIGQQEPFYAGLYQMYIAPCITLLEEEKWQECKCLYQDMVKRLKAQFLPYQDEKRGELT